MSGAPTFAVGDPTWCHIRNGIAGSAEMIDRRARANNRRAVLARIEADIAAEVERVWALVPEAGRVELAATGYTDGYARRVAVRAWVMAGRVPQDELGAVIAATLRMAEASRLVEVAAAERARLVAEWAASGRTVRFIAAETGLSPARVQQLIELGRTVG